MLTMVEYVHHRLAQYPHFKTGVDMTVGNGYDTLVLSKCCDDVIGFDIQQEAIDQASKLLVDCDNVRLILDNHANIDQYVIECDVTVFNLGYLPMYSHTITTLLDTTKIALNKAIELTDTVIFVVVYPGHDEGFIESQWIDEYVSELSSKKYNVSKYCMLNKNKAPYVIEIEKRKTHRS